MSDMQQRLSQANAAIAMVASCGRKFYYSYLNNCKGELVLSGEVEPISVLYIDPDTDKHTSISNATEWNPLIAPPARRLLLALASYVLTGKKVPHDLIAPPYHSLSGNQWQYDETSAQWLREEFKALPMMSIQL
jgi:hypothetical protein